MRAASSSSTGMLFWMKVRATIMLYTLSAPGMSMAQTVLVMRRRLTSR